jgi:hypothetical protein
MDNNVPIISLADTSGVDASPKYSLDCLLVSAATVYQPLEITRALRYISRRQYLRGINLLMICRSGFQKALNEVFANKVRQEVSQMAKQKIISYTLY